MTKTIADIKKEKEEKVSKLMEEVSMFFAFSNEQFSENKTALKEGDKYVHIGAGGYLPKSNVDTFLDGMEGINKWYKNEIKGSKLREKNIAYELGNFECYYTGDIQPAVDALGSEYTREEIMVVYKKNYKKWEACNA